MVMNFRTLDLNLLRVFDVVMTERHVTRAAERLAMTQPAVSNALRRLRDALADELFIPVPSGVAPTRRAQTLWPEVGQALKALRDAIEPQDFDPLREERAFTVAMADATAAVIVPLLMEQWHKTGTRSSWASFPTWPARRARAAHRPCACGPCTRANTSRSCGATIRWHASAP
jgi:DNA-binding transcriptional LysR family regulator